MTCATMWVALTTEVGQSKPATSPSALVRPTPSAPSPFSLPPSHARLTPANGVQMSRVAPPGLRAGDLLTQRSADDLS